MTAPVSCPSCEGRLVADGEDTFVCAEGHRYTVVGLALSVNIAALRALWMGIRALEDDAAGLVYMAEHYGDDFGMSAEQRLAEADAARHAAEVLRDQARRAQERLDALPSAPSTIRENGSQRGRGG